MKSEFFSLESVRTKTKNVQAAQEREGLRTSIRNIQLAAEEGQTSVTIKLPYPNEVMNALEKHFVSLGFKATYYEGTREFVVNW